MVRLVEDLKTIPNKKNYVQTPVLRFLYPFALNRYVIMIVLPYAFFQVFILECKQYLVTSGLYFKVDVDFCVSGRVFNVEYVIWMHC